MPQRRVVVVGAGIGGLAAALDLARSGCAVTVVERAAAPGGKMREVTAGGRAIDAGPTVLTMRWVFDALFEAAGEPLGAHLTLHPAEILARHAWSERERLDLFASRDRSAEAIGDFAGAAEARGYRDFCARAERTYRTLEAPFIRAARPSPLALARAGGLRGLPGLWRIAPFQTLWAALGEHFRDPRLRQLFGRYATYCGCSPYQAPATLVLVAHVEQAGVWLVEGGMHSIAAALARLAAARGAVFRYGSEARRIALRSGRVCAAVLDDGEVLEADAIVVNADPAALAAGLFGPDAARAVPAQPASGRSLSAVTWASTARTAGLPLVRHNVFFSADYAAEFADIFGRSRLPAAPTVYVCAQDRGGADTAAPAGRERLLCLVNAPATGDRREFAPAELAACADAAFGLLSRCGLAIERDPEATVVTTPAGFGRLFPATGGALYGQAGHGWRAAFTRPGARTRLPGLFLCGGGVHPGPGVPMAALSGRLAAAAVLETRTD